MRPRDIPGPLIFFGIAAGKPSRRGGRLRCLIVWAKGPAADARCKRYGVSGDSLGFRGSLHQKTIQCGPVQQAAARNHSQDGTCVPDVL